jgi:hypothetical protein
MPDIKVLSTREKCEKNEQLSIIETIFSLLYAKTKQKVNFNFTSEILSYPVEKHNMRLNLF